MKLCSNKHTAYMQGNTSSTTHASLKNRDLVGVKHRHGYGRHQRQGRWQISTHLATPHRKKRVLRPYPTPTLRQVCSILSKILHEQPEPPRRRLSHPGYPCIPRSTLIWPSTLHALCIEPLAPVLHAGESSQAHHLPDLDTHQGAWRLH